MALRSKASRTRSKSTRAGCWATELIEGLAQTERRAAEGIRGRPPEHLAQARSQALGKLLEVVLLLGVIDHALGLDHLTRHVLEIAQRVGEAHLDTLLSRPDEPRIDVGGLLQAPAAA